MRLSKTIAAMRRLKRDMSVAASVAAPHAHAAGRLTTLAGMSANPGRLRALCYVPEGLESGAPLVVVLHGCTQNAAAYDLGAGWSALADRHGFSLLFPEQQRSNNQNLCFNWFEPEDIKRGGGEAASIAAMVDRMAELHGSDRDRIFITGLSAGGAMTSVMLAAYPDLFAAGAVVAGLPFGCASGVAEAFACMGGRGGGSDAMLGDRVRAASSHTGPWPRISVWHGSLDHTVAGDNADDLVKQWRDLHGLPQKPSRTEQVGGHSRRVWIGDEAQELVEQYSIKGMGHGTPLDPGEGEDQLGRAGPHMLDAGINSTARIAEFWGIVPKAARAAGTRNEAKSPPPTSASPPPNGAAPKGVQQVIEDALRSSGLLR